MKMKMFKLIVSDVHCFARAADHSTRGHPDQRARTTVGSQETRDHPFGKVQEPVAGLRLNRQWHGLLTFSVAPVQLTAVSCMSPSTGK